MEANYVVRASEDANAMANATVKAAASKLKPMEETEGEWVSSEAAPALFGVLAGGGGFQWWAATCYLAALASKHPGSFLEPGYTCTHLHPPSPTPWCAQDSYCKTAGTGVANRSDAPVVQANQARLSAQYEQAAAEAAAKNLPLDPQWHSWWVGGAAVPVCLAALGVR